MRDFRTKERTSPFFEEGEEGGAYSIARNDFRKEPPLLYSKKRRLIVSKERRRKSLRAPASPGFDTGGKWALSSPARQRNRKEEKKRTGSLNHSPEEKTPFCVTDSQEG